MLSDARLITLTGPGGVGKTRLALRVADQVRRAFPDGVWLVELAALRDPDLLAATVAAVWGVADGAAVPIHPLTAYLKDKRLLLIVDNCEHVLDGCAPVLGKVLAAAPELHVLATSRQPLRVEGEHVVPVPPLSVPDPDALPVGNLQEFEAVRPFV